MATYAIMLMSGSLALILADFIPRQITRLLDELILFSFIAVVLLAIIWTKRLYLSAEIGLTLLFILLGVSVSIAQNVPIDILLLGLLLTVKPLIVFFAFQLIPLDRINSHKLLNNFITFISIVVIISLIYSFVFETVLNTNLIPTEGNVTLRLGNEAARSFYTHSTQFSGMMTFAIFIFFARFLLKVGNNKFNVFMILLSLLGILITTRLKGLLLMPIGLLIEYFLITYRTGKIKKRIILQTFAFLAVSLLIILLIVIVFRDIFIFRFFSDTPSVRVALFTFATQINIDTFGLGVGYGMYGSSISVNYHYSDWYYISGISELRGAKPQNPSFVTDQWWAWYLGEVGLIGTIIFMWIFWKISVKLNVIANYHFEHNKSLSSFAYAAISALAFGVLSGFAGTFLSGPPTGIFVVAIAGMAFSLSRGLGTKEAVGC